MNLIVSEASRLYRGLNAMREALGLQFTTALVLTFGLLLWAVLYTRGALAFVLGLVLVLLAIRAHDLGEDPDEGKDRTEFDEFWDDSPAAQREREDAFLSEQIAEAKARAAQANFLANRGTAALGKPHEPQEL